MWDGKVIPIMANQGESPLEQFEVIQERRQTVLKVRGRIVQVTTREGGERAPAGQPVYGYWFIRLDEGDFEEHQGNPEGYASHDEAFADMLTKIKRRLDMLEMDA